MTLNNHKWIVKVLVLLLVSFVTWWATQVWGTQEEQGTSITTLQASIMSTDKTVQRIEACLIEDRIHRRKQEIHRRQQDSVLIDIAIKVNLMFDGR